MTTQAKTQSTTPSLSSLIRDPFVRSAFERAERDNDALGAVVDNPPSLDSGAAEQLCQSTFWRSRVLVEA